MEFNSVNSVTQYKTPVALFIFNRPDVTSQTFSRIAMIKPEVLLIISDGARSFVEGEQVLVERTRKIIDNVNWPCKLITNFSERNLGCRNRMITGISWVFENVSEAIILEDDCLPTLTFFEFVEEMLNKYRNSSDVFSIAGSCFTGDTTADGHLLSEYSLMWGWATWSNRWLKYDADAKGYKSIVFSKWWNKPIDCLYWMAVFRNIKNGSLNSAWDYQWILTLWREHAKCVRPTVNLVENIGFGPDATHTKSGSRFDLIGKYTGSVGELRHQVTDRDSLGRYSNADRRLWAMINIKTVLLLFIPMLARFKRTKN